MVCMCKRRVPDFPMTKCGDATRGRGKGTRANRGQRTPPGDRLLSDASSKGASGGLHGVERTVR